MGEVTHQAVDGATVRWSGDVDLGRPFTSTARISVGWVLHEFAVGPPGVTPDFVATRPGAAVEVLRHRGGDLTVITARVTDPATETAYDHVMGVWEGARHSLTVHTVDATSGGVVALLEAVDVTEGPDGIALTPGPRAAWHDDAVLVKEIPGVGLAEARPLTSAQAATLPRWEGTHGAGGEVFREAGGDGPGGVLVVGASAVVRLLPEDVDGGADAAAAAALGLTVTWEAA